MKYSIVFLSLLFSVVLFGQSSCASKIELAEKIYLQLSNSDGVKIWLKDQGYKIESDDAKHSVFNSGGHVLDIHFDQKKHIDKVVMYFDSLDEITECIFISNYYSCEEKSRCYEKKIPAVRLEVESKTKSLKMYRIGSMF